MWPRTLDRVSQIVVSIVVVGTCTVTSHGTPDPCVELFVSEHYTLGADTTVEFLTIRPFCVLSTGGHTLTITGMDGLVCELGSCLEVDSGIVRLTGGGNASLAPASAIVIAGNSSRVEVLTRPLTLLGDGHLVGCTSAATLEVGPNTTLTNSTLIHGNLTLTGSGTLRNNGLVRADFSGMITLDQHLHLADRSGAVRWQVADSCDARLRFRRTHSGASALVGNIAVEFGTLDLDAAIATSGALLYDSGVIDVAAGASLSFVGASGDCETEPVSPVAGPALFEGCIGSGCE